MVAQVKRRRELWREKVIENEGSLSKQSNEWTSRRKETQRETQKKMERQILRIVARHFDYFVQYVDYQRVR